MSSAISAGTIRYTERLSLPWSWWLIATGATLVLGVEVQFAVGPGVTEFLGYPITAILATALLLSMSRSKIWVTENADGVPELWAGDAHLPATAVGKAAAVPRSAKSAAMGRQLDPAAWVFHRSWVRPMLLLVLDDPEDPTPYWLISTKHPDRVLAALGLTDSALNPT